MIVVLVTRQTPDIDPMLVDNQHWIDVSCLLEIKIFAILCFVIRFTSIVCVYMSQSIQHPISSNVFGWLLFSVSHDSLTLTIFNVIQSGL